MVELRIGIVRGLEKLLHGIEDQIVRPINPVWLLGMDSRQLPIHQRRSAAPLCHFSPSTRGVRWSLFRPFERLTATS